jgi:hypothetical protein
MNSAYEQLMAALRDEPEAVVLETLDAYNEMEAEQDKVRDWRQPEAAQEAIDEIMQR